MSEQVESPGIVGFFSDVGRSVPGVAWSKAIRPLHIRTLRRHAPEGNGIPVMTLPGLIATRWTTRDTRDVLHALGFKPYSSGLRQANLGPRDKDRIPFLKDRVARIADKHGQPVFLPGHSLGGVDALLLAYESDDVSGVLTWDSPVRLAFVEGGVATPVRTVFDLLNRPDSALTRRYIDTLKEYAQDGPPKGKPVTNVVALDGTLLHQHIAAIPEWAEKHRLVEAVGLPGRHCDVPFGLEAFFVVAHRTHAASKSTRSWRPIEMEAHPAIFGEDPMERLRIPTYDPVI